MTNTIKHNITIILLVFSQFCTANNDFFHYGLAAKATIEFGRINGKKIKIKKNKYIKQYQGSRFKIYSKFSIVGGIGYNFHNIIPPNKDKNYDLHVNFFPTLHGGFILFSKGTFGGSASDPNNKVRVHSFCNIITTFGGGNRNIKNRNLPLYHFSDFVANPLQNPYDNFSLSFGKIWISLQEKNKQRVGFFNANIGGVFQASYYNEGGPVLSLLGDQSDRYYTGGLIFSCHTNNIKSDNKHDSDIETIELSYHKFTSFTPHAFHIQNRLQLDWLKYEKNEIGFNQGRWRLTTTTKDKIEVSISIYEFLDLQDGIHFRRSNPFHPDFYKKIRYTISGGGYFSKYSRTIETRQK